MTKNKNYSSLPNFAKDFTVLNQPSMPSMGYIDSNIYNLMICY